VLLPSCAQSALAAPSIRVEALGALCGMLGEAAEEVAPVNDDDAAAVRYAARAAGVGPAWVAAASAHRDAQAATVFAWAAAAERWAEAAREDAARLRGKRGRSDAADV
jgi:hypothetical protein